MSLVIQIFARAPVPGRCKTRLIPALGAAGAAALYSVLLADTVAHALAVPDAEVQLWLDGDPEHPALPGLAGLQLHSQPAGDLGARMLHAADRAVAAGRRVLLIGSDCPTLAPAQLAAAGAALATRDLVLAPAVDGGYVLLGLAPAARPALAGLFSGMPWSTDRVAAMTLQRAATAGLSTLVLDGHRDIDEPADLQALRALPGWAVRLDALSAGPGAPSGR